MDAIIKEVQKCVGLPTNQPVRHYISKPKLHGGPTDYVKSLAKHVSTQGRHHGLNHADRVYTNEVLDSELMKVFGYQYAPLSVLDNDLVGPFDGNELPHVDAQMWWLPESEKPFWQRKVRPLLDQNYPNMYLQTVKVTRKKAQNDTSMEKKK